MYVLRMISCAKPVFLLSLSITLLSASGIASVPDLDSKNATYDKIYPQYAEYCGLSQITKTSSIGIKEVGGQGGHGVLFLRGACRDRSFGYPRIKVCEASDRLPHEVGTSVNSDFMSVNWTAIDNRDFFFTGGIKPDQLFDVTAYERVQTEAQELDIMNGVEIHPELLQRNHTPGVNDVQYVYQDSVGTDYGISLGRDMTCARVPVSDRQIREIVDYYNSRNAYYHDNHIPYVWNVFNDNCTHITDNALASAGFWSPLKLDRPLPTELGNLAIPQNAFVNLMLRANELPLEEPDQLFGDEYARKALLERDWLPTEPGALSEFIPVHAPNQIFGTKLTDILFQIPFLDPAASERSNFLSERRYTEVKANLEHFLKRYQNVEKDRRPIGAYTQPQGNLAARVLDPGFTDFYSKYYQYIHRQIALTIQKLQKMEQL